MKRFILVLLGSALVSNFGLTQIEISKETTPKKVRKQSAKTNEDSLRVEVLLAANWSQTSRELIENEGLFAKPLGERAFETPLNKWSFGLTMRSPITKFVSWQGGIRYLQNGEAYRFEAVDTMYSYSSHYSYISMPLKLEFTYGKKLGLIVGLGVEPQMFSGYKKEIAYQNSEGDVIEEVIKTRIGMNSFVLSLNASVGAYYAFADRWALHVVPEYRHQLISSFYANSPYKHYARAIGLNVMIGFKL